MIIWKGLGILVLLITVVCIALMSMLFKNIGSTEEMGTAVGIMLSGIAIWFADRKMNAPEKQRTFIDKQTRQEVIVRPDHSFFFIKMQYWAFIMGAIGVSHYQCRIIIWLTRSCNVFLLLFEQIRWRICSLIAL